MCEPLKFNPENYEKKSCTAGGRTITCRAWEGISYCEHPVDEIQKLNLFAPDSFAGTAYDWKSAPIFVPNSVGGYMPGPCEEPGEDPWGNPNSLFCALEHGYVVASIGCRGSATKDRQGKAPALLVDMKAGIRYLRRNRDLIPGNTERIITSGTSAGGALSAMTGASGNHPDYEPYLSAIGAADERDDIFAANCYCPIHNLENADSAYEWLFSGCSDYHRTFAQMTPEGMQFTEEDGRLSEKQKSLSPRLRAMFPDYINSLQLKTADGSPLRLDENGDGSFKDYVCDLIADSAARELDTHNSQNLPAQCVVEGSEVEHCAGIEIRDGRVTGVDLNAYAAAITRMKTVPAFDALDLSSPENREFGTTEKDAQHFTAFAQDNSEVPAALADPAVVRLINPLPYIMGEQSDTAKYWRIRHGSFDRDTSLAIPALLAAVLRNYGKSVDFFFPWGVRHSGDYDLEELFAWIDSIC